MFHFKLALLVGAKNRIEKRMTFCHITPCVVGKKIVSFAFGGPFGCSLCCHNRPMVTRGAKIKNRTPEPLRTRSDSTLKRNAVRQVIIDLESGKVENLTSADKLIKSNPEVYGSGDDPRVLRAVQRKLRFLRRLKGENPKEYW